MHPKFELAWPEAATRRFTALKTRIRLTPSPRGMILK